MQHRLIASLILSATVLACASPTPAVTPVPAPTTAAAASPSVAPPTPPGMASPVPMASPVTTTSTSPASSTARPTLEPRPTPAEGAFQLLTVDELGFTAVKDEANDYATYAVVMTNPNTEWAVYRLPLEVNFFDASDVFLGTADVHVTLLPGQTTAVAGQVFGAGGAVRMEATPPEDATPYEPFTSSGTIEVSDLETATTDVGLLTTGNLTSSLTSDQSFLQLYSVYRDDTGSIIGGATGGVESVPSGATAGFEIADPQPPDGRSRTDVYWQLGGPLP